VPPRSKVLVKGDQVRILYWPHFGRIGHVKAIRDEMVELESGIQAPVATVSFSGDIQVDVPISNMEVVS